jgi:septal ring factor EnvC (AmiA/AmiB activator)
MPLENPDRRGVYAEALLEESDSMSLDRLKLLEGRVDEALARHSALSAERDRLQEELKQAQTRITEMTGQLATFEKERAQVRARVESILGRLEGLDLS